LVTSRPEFRQYPSQPTRNPFTGSTMMLLPPADAALVVLEGRVVGEVSLVHDDHRA
jgi:hypothetical protein